jgi:hypothetical protein
MGRGKRVATVRTRAVAWDRANRADLRAAVAAAVVAELLAARSRVPGVGEAEGWGVGIERDCSGRECGW